VNVPVAVNCCVWPAAIDGFAGVIASETRIGATTLTPVAPVTLPDVARIFAVPTLTACARPAVLMVTNVVALELHVTDEVRLLELPSLNWPSAVYCCVVPFGSDAPAGVTVIETSVADVTVSLVEALTLPDVAPMVELPAAMVVASPAALIVATAAVEDVHVTALVTSCMLPSLKVPAAVNCCICPAAIVGLDGEITIETRAAGLTVTLVEPVMLAEVAITFALPTANAFAMPDALTETVAGALELQVAEDVKSRVLPLLNWPTALNC